MIWHRIGSSSLRSVQTGRVIADCTTASHRSGAHERRNEHEPDFPRGCRASSSSGASDACKLPNGEQPAAQRTRGASLRRSVQSVRLRHRQSLLVLAPSGQHANLLFGPRSRPSSPPPYKATPTYPPCALKTRTAAHRTGGRVYSPARERGTWTLDGQQARASGKISGMIGLVAPSTRPRSSRNHAVGLVGDPHVWMRSD